jgi:prepilin peptidase CpaA
MLSGSYEQLLIAAVLAAVVIPAAVFDYFQHRIPNWLALSGWAVGLLLHAVLSGWPGLLTAAIGWGWMMLIMFPLFVLGWMGAGDVKLTAAVGAIVGGHQALYVLAGIVLTGLAMALLVLVKNKLFRRSMQRYGASIGLSLAARRPTYIGPGIEEQQLVLPYAVPIAIGALVSAWVLYL